MSKRIAKSIISAAVIAGMALSAAPASAHDVSVVKNATLPFKSGLDSVDRLTLIRSAGTPGKVTICLAAGSKVTWWKTLEVYAGPNRPVGKLEVKDANKGPNCLAFDTNEFAPKYSRFALVKAKGLNLPSNQAFHRFSPWAYDGKTFTIRWDAD